MKWRGAIQLTRTSLQGCGHLDEVELVRSRTSGVCYQALAAEALVRSYISERPFLRARTPALRNFDRLVWVETVWKLWSAIIRAAGTSVSDTCKRSPTLA